MDNETNGTGNAYDFGARIYDARLGRFAKLDPIPAFSLGLSHYSYCYNSPISNIDIEGMFVIDSKDPNATLLRRYVEATKKLLADPFVYEEFKKHSGLSDADITEMLTEGYGPTLTIGKPSNPNYEAEYVPNGTAKLSEMGIYKDQTLAKDKIILNEELFLKYKELTTNNMLAHHSFFTSMIILHELVHLGDLRTDGVKNNNVDYSKYSNDERSDMKEISKGYPKAVSDAFQDGIEPGKAFEYSIMTWEITRENIKDMYKIFQRKSTSDKKQKEKDHPGHKSPRNL